MKKLLALGGSGHMGQKAVQTVLENRNLEQLIIADNNLEKATAFASSLNDGRVQVVGIDVQDTDSLVTLMKKADVVMNTIGPFYKYAVPVVRAAIAARKNYVDIDDDYKPTQEVFEFDKDARKAGVTVIQGMGASPGISNIIARYAAQQLDEVDYIQTAWGIAGGIRRPRSVFTKEFIDLVKAEAGDAAIGHLIYCASWKIPIFKNGKFVEVIPLQEGEDVAFPNGKAFFKYIGHPEPVTLPRFIKGIRGACNLCGMEPEEFDTALFLGQKVRDKEISLEKAVEMFPDEILKRLQQRPDHPEHLGPLKWGIIVSVSGLKKGKKVRYTYGPRGAPRGDMIGVTGISVALAANMLLNDEIRQPGVFAPEGCVDPDLFFKRYVKYWDYDNKRYWIPKPISIGQALWKVEESL
ncbi:MAG: saccharopine dehydrogenase NADP-binding domain-containing protein [Dehalococcoidia bacterium]